MERAEKESGGPFSVGNDGEWERKGEWGWNSVS